MSKRPFTCMHAISSLLLASILAFGWSQNAPLNDAAYPVLIIFLITGALIAFNLSRVPFPPKDDRE